MKKLITTTAVVALVSASTVCAKGPSDIDCKDMYQNIKAILDQGLISIETAQVLWKDWEQIKHS